MRTAIDPDRDRVAQEVAEERPADEDLALVVVLAPDLQSDRPKQIAPR